MNNEDATAVNAILTLAQFQLQGMIAENKRRELNGQAYAYGEHEFLMAEQELRTKLALYMDLR